MSASAAGLILLAFPLAMAVLGLVAGALADRWGSRPTAVAGAGVIVAGLLLLALLFTDNSKETTMSATHPETVARSRATAWHVILWILQILVAAMFLFSSGMKLVGAQPMVELFNAIASGSCSGADRNHYG